MTDLDNLLGADFVELASDALKRREPVYLVLVAADVRRARAGRTLETDPVFADVEAAVGASLLERLQQHWRPYDTIVQGQEASCLLLVKTMAEPEIIRARLDEIGPVLAAPHELSVGYITVPVFIGAAMRRPADPVQVLTQSAIEALRQAQIADRPVLIA